MRCTLLNVGTAGVQLARWHARRLAPEGPAVVAAFDAFCRQATPGIWALTAADGVLSWAARPRSRLHDGMPTRWAVSPWASSDGGWFPKPASPSAYDAVRAPGVATLLTSTAGTEILEACCAAVLGWDDGWVCVPSARPRVESVAEQAIRSVLPVREAALAVASPQPLVLVNAVKGVCLVSVPGRAAPPSNAVADLRRALSSAG